MAVLSILVTLVLPALVVLAIVLAVRRQRDHGAGTPEPRGQAVRRFFQYVVLLGLLIVAATGLTGLLEPLFDTQGIVSRSDATLAQQLTFTFMGLPLFLALGWWTLRRLRTDPDEARSLGWSFYLTVATVISLATAMIGAYGALASLVESGPLSANDVAITLVWTLVWAVHQSLAVRTTSPAERRMIDLAGSLIGLGAAAVGLARLVAASVRGLTDLGGETIVGNSTDQLLEAAVLVMIGAVVWVYYWLLNLAPSQHDTAWLGYVLLPGVAAGLVTALAAMSYGAFDVLVWLVGDTRGAPATEHFSELPGLVGATVVGALVWWYHQAVLGAGRTGERREVRRVYEYLMAGIGLVTAASGLTMVIVAIIEAVAGGRDILVGVSTVNTLIAAVTLLAVGVPVWWWHWRLTQRAAGLDPVAEVASPTRRIYLVLLFGVIGVVAVIALLTGVYLALEDVLADGVSAETLRSVRFALAILVAASVVSGYHWSVFRDDRRHAQTRADPVRPPGHVLLVGPADAAVARAVAERTASTVELRRRLDDSAPWSVDAVVAAIESARAGAASEEGTDLIVLSAPDGLQLIRMAPASRR